MIRSEITTKCNKKKQSLTYGESSIQKSSKRNTKILINFLQFSRHVQELFAIKDRFQFKIKKVSKCMP